MALTTLDEIKIHLGITAGDESENTSLQQWLVVATSLLEDELRYRVEQATVTEFYSGNGTNLLILKNRPVQSITSLYLDSGGYFGQGASAFAAATLQTSGVDYYLDKSDASHTESSQNGFVYRIGGTWPGRRVTHNGLLTPMLGDGQGNIKVTYVAGYAVVPAKYKVAIHGIIALLRRSSVLGQGIPVSGFSLDYFSTTFAGNAEAQKDLTSVMAIIGRNKKWVV